MANRFPALSEIILHEDEHLLVVNKPPYLPSLEERQGGTLNLLQMVRQAYPEASLAHRLDKETSGALAVGKDAETYRHLSLQFQKRQVEKVYWAVAEGVWQWKEEMIDLPLASVKGRARVSRSKGKPAQTVIKTLQTFRHYTLVECRPVTGRMHQIRVHLQSVGAPIAADVAYGGKLPLVSNLKRNYRPKDEREERPMMPRVALHAKELHLNTLDEKRASVEAPHPNDFQTFLKMLERYD